MLKMREFFVFVDEVKYWVIKFGLLDYEIRILTTEEEGVRGTCTTYSSNADRITDICVQKNWSKPDHEDLCRVAFHEVCELLMREFLNICSVHIAEMSTTTELHRIIRRLENSYFIEDYSRRIKKGEKEYGRQTRLSIFASRTEGASPALVCVDTDFGPKKRHASDHTRRSKGSDKRLQRRGREAEAGKARR